MRTAVLVFCLSASSVSGETIGQFRVEDATLNLRVRDVAVAKAQFGDSGAGLHIQFSEEYGQQFAAFTHEALGKLMRFEICGDEILRATVQDVIKTQVMVAADSVGAAVWYEAYLTGGRSCND